MSVRIKPRNGKRPITRTPSELPSATAPLDLRVPEVMTSEPESVARLRADTSDVSVSERTGTLHFYVGCIVLFLITALSIALYATARFMPKQREVIPEEKPISSIQPIPTSTPSAVPVTLEILNGSGKAGAAKQAAETVTRLGFEVISVGNTSIQDGNTLQLAEGVRSRAEEIIARLSEFNISDQTGTVSGSTVSARLILGK